MKNEIAKKHHKEMMRWFLEKRISGGEFAQKVGNLGVKYPTVVSWIYYGAVPTEAHCANIKAAGYPDCPLISWRKKIIDTRRKKLV